MKMRKFKFLRVALTFLSFIIVAGLSGCATSAGRMMGPENPFDYVYGKTDSELKASFSTLKTQIDADEASYYASGATPAQQKQLRNKIINELRTPTEDLWRRYESAVWGDTAAIRSGLSVGTATLSAGAAISPINVAHAISVLAGTLTSISTAMDSNVFQAQALPVILQQIQADMALYKTKIDQGLLDEVDKYPLANALSDLEEYAQSMTIPHALTEIAAAAGAQKQQLKSVIQQTVQATQNVQVQAAGAAAATLELSKTQSQISIKALQQQQ